ncbi:MAG: periplasmic heavy metal sensor [Bryobacterales bacterium]|nr:periplasmic heavy metal sensor [Bryobacterales bacterium]
MKIRIAALVCLALPLLAQNTPQQPPQPPPLTELKAYLTLTDSQVTQLQSLVQAERQANQPRVQEINTKEQQLRTALNNNSNDAAALGRLLIDIQALRRQITTTAENFRTQATALLNDTQRTKLRALDEASKLAPSIRQAVSVNLLAPPAPPTGASGPGAPPMAPRRFGPPRFDE